MESEQNSLDTVPRTGSCIASPLNWLRSGGDLVVLHKILGHAKIQTTMEYFNIVPTGQGKELVKVQFD